MSEEIAAADSLLTANAELRDALRIAMEENEQRIALERRLVAELEAARRVVDAARRYQARPYGVENPTLRALLDDWIRAYDDAVKVRME